MSQGFDITNSRGYPEYVYDAVVRTQSRHSELPRPAAYTAKHLISVTELLLPPRAYALLQNVRPDRDCSEFGSTLRGHAMDDLLHDQTTGNHMVSRVISEGQHALYCIYGHPDRVEQDAVIDRKSMTLASFCRLSDDIKNNRGHDYVWQVNIYNWCMSFSKRNLFLDCFIADPAPGNGFFHRLAVPMFDPLITEAFIVAMAKLATDALTDLPRCTGKDQWADSGFIVVDREGQHLAETADMEEAVSVAASRPNRTIKTKTGTPKRCAWYCPARSVCDQGKRAIEAAKDKR